MRIEISYKFIIGFLVVLASAVAVDLAVPHLQIAPEFQQTFSVACALVVGLIIGAVFSRVFSANIRRLTAAGERIGQGDLSQDVALKSVFPDETGDLAASMNQIQASLRALVGDTRTIAFKVARSAQGLSATSREVSSSALEVSGSIEQISKGAETQAAMVEESTRLFREMAMSINLVAASARKVSAAAQQTVETADQGSSLAGASLGSISQVLSAVEGSGRQMLGFVAHLEKISRFVEVINGIAQKTNLLALNATIESSRAGEYGRGFAVVAEEIRKLADSATLSADEITALVEAIRAEGGQVQASMLQVTREMESGREAVDRTNKAFSAITRNAQETHAKAHSIAELAEQQISGAERISRAIDEIDKIVSDNAAATQQVSAATQEQSAAMEDLAQAARDLSVLSESMLRIVKRFRLVQEEKG